MFFPDSICLGQSAQGINTGPTNWTYKWDIGGGDFFRTPTTTSIPIPGISGSLSGVSIIKSGTKYYGFVLLNSNNALARLDFDTSLLNNPTITNLGNIGAALANGSCLKVLKSGSNYFAFTINRTASQLVRYSFGSDISSTPTVSTFASNALGLTLTLDFVEEGNDFYVLAPSYNQGKMGLFSFTGGPSSTPVFTSYPIQGGNYLNISLVETCEGKYAVLNDGPTGTTAKVNRLKYSNSFSQINPTLVMTDLPLLTHRPGPSFVTRDGGRWISLVSGWTTGGGFTLYNFGKNLESPPALISVLAGAPLAISSISLPQLLTNGSTCVLYTTESGVLGRLIFPNLNPSSSGSLMGFQPPAVSYSSPGKYFINYTATSPEGVVIQGGDSIVVRNATSTGIVKTDFSADEQCPSKVSKFYPQVSPTGTHAYKWTFPGNVTQTTAIGSRQFSTPGMYEVTLYSRKSDGCGTSSITRQIKIFATPGSSPISNFTAPTQVCTKDSVLFSDQSTWAGNTIRRWKWDFGSGQIAFTKNARAYFQTNQAGQNIPVSLTASDSSGCGTAVTKSVIPQAGADVEFASTKLCKGDVTEFQNNTPLPTGVNFLWNFGEPSSGGNNTSTSSAPVVTHAYADSGFFQVALQAVTSNGCTSQVSKQVQVFPLPAANFTFPAVAFPNTPISFTNSSTAKYQTISSYIWSFGDPTSGAANSSIQTNPTHNFATFGSYDVNLKATSNKSCVGETTKSIGIYPNCPDVSYSIAPGPSGNYDTLYFTNSTTLVKETRIDYCAGDLDLNPVLQSQQTGTPPISNASQIVPVRDGNQWYGFIPSPISTNSTSFFKATFGNSINNDISNFSTGIGNPQNQFSSPSFIRLFKEDSIWFGIAANGNKLYRLRFGQSLDNNGPTVSEIVLPNGILTTPVGAQIIRERDSIFVFIVNNNNQISNNLIRLRFKQTLLDTPNVAVYSNPPVLQNSTGFYGITFYKECQNWYALLVGKSQLYRLNYGFSLNNNPGATSLTGEVTAGLASPNAFDNLRGIGILNDMGKAYGLINTSNGSLFRVRFGQGISQPADGVTSLGTLGISGTVGAFNFVQSGTEYFVFAMNTTGTVFKIKFPNKCPASLPYSVKTSPGIDTVLFSQPGKYYITVTAESPLGTISQRLDSVVIADREITLSCPKTAINHPNEICFDYKLNPSTVQTDLSNVKWDFCAGDFRLPPQVGAAPFASGVSVPGAVQTIFQGGNYYTFIAGTSGMSRLNLGASPDGIPGQPIGITMPSGASFSVLQDIRFFNESNNWFALCVYQNGESIVRLNFGPNITNTTPGFTLINLPGLLAKSRGIDLFEDVKSKYAMITNQENGTIVLLDFGASYRNVPSPYSYDVASAINLFKVSVVRECNLWHALITDLAQDSLFKLTFTRGLYSKPVQSSISVSKGQGVSAVRDGFDYYAFVSKVQTNFQNVIRLSFGNSLLNTPKLDSLGNFPFTTPATGLTNVAGMQIFQTDGSQYYLFGVGTGNGNLYRVKFRNTCSASIPIAGGDTVRNQSYSSDGKYYYTVSGYNSSGDLVLGFDSVIVKNLVEANFTIPGNRCKGEPILFADGSTHGDFTSITDWSWNFGDPTTVLDTSNFSNPSYTFNQSGTYPVKLRVREAGGCVNELTRLITVADKPKPNFSWAGSGGLCTNDSIVFTDLSQTTNDPIIVRNWEVRQNGQLLFTSTRQNPKFWFSTIGTYSVSLLIKGQSLCDSSVTKTVDISAVGALVSFSNESACLNEPAYFASQISGVTPDSIAWYVDNARITSLQAFTYTFNTTNTYTVRLIVYNGACANTFSKIIQVNIKPAFTINIQAPLKCQGLPANFSANLSTNEGVKFLWQFGDGTSDTSRNATKSFAAAGTYNVKLKVYTENGCARTDSSSFTAKQSPIALFSFDKACKDEPINFANLSSANGIVGGITSYFWDFGNGATSDQLNPGPIFYNEPPGVKIVALTVRTAEECPNTYTRYIPIGPKIAANFRYESGCIGTNFRFFDNTITGADSIVNWNWNIGGLNYTTRNPAVQFDLQGTYGVRLKVISSSGCIDDVNRTNEFTVLDSARADFRILDNTFSEAPFYVRVQQIPSANDSYEYLWDYGDGSTSTSPTPSAHNYETEGTYIITLKAWRAGTICSTQVQRVVNVVVNTKQGIAVRRIFSGSSNGQLAVGMELENESNVALRSLNLTAKLGSLATLREQWNGILLPGASLNYNFKSTVLTQSTQKIDYICGTAELIDKDKEFSPGNNSLCISQQPEASLVSVFPNPAASEFSIELSLPGNEPIELKVFNSLGKEAISFTDNNPNIGVYQKKFSLFDLASGVYTVWFRSGKILQTKRLIVFRE